MNLNRTFLIQAVTTAVDDFLAREEAEEAPAPEPAPIEPPPWDDALAQAQDDWVNRVPAGEKRKKQLVFLVTPEQESRLTHLRADLGSIDIQTLFTRALNLLLESQGKPPLL